MYRKILVPVDLHESGRSAVALAAAAMLAHASDASLTLLTILSDWSVLARAERSPITTRLLFESAHARLAAQGDRMENAGPVTCRVESGFAYRAILTAAREIGADLIIIAPPPARWTDAIFGTTVSRVSRRAQCSVLIVRD